MPRFQDITGQRFGRLVVLARRDHNRFQQWRWLCQCDCGGQTIVAGNALRSGNTKSCRCLEREARIRHGQSRKPIYLSWADMHQRCRNSKNPEYKNYGGRGIRICERWLKFENFLLDMGKKPADTSLDRIDNDGNYEPANCRWATRSIQRKNQRPRKRDANGRFVAHESDER